MPGYRTACKQRDCFIRNVIARKKGRGQGSQPLFVQQVDPRRILAPAENVARQQDFRMRAPERLNRTRRFDRIGNQLCNRNAGIRDAVDE